MTPIKRELCYEILDKIAEAMALGVQLTRALALGDDHMVSESELAHILSDAEQCRSSLFGATEEQQIQKDKADHLAAHQAYAATREGTTEDAAPRNTAEHYDLMRQHDPRLTVFTDAEIATMLARSVGNHLPKIVDRSEQLDAAE